jgi:hypothetical protein
MSSHRIQSVGSSTPKQLCTINAAQRKKQKPKYNYSISASDIDQQTLIHFLSREFGKDFRVKVSFEQLFPFVFYRPNEAKP